MTILPVYECSRDCVAFYHCGFYRIIDCWLLAVRFIAVFFYDMLYMSVKLHFVRKLVTVPPIHVATINAHIVFI